MARPGITYEDVCQAADYWREQSIEPTVDRVRSKIGSGSKSTIAPLLKRWRTEVQSPETQALPELPDALIRALQELHLRTQQIAQSRIEASAEIARKQHQELSEQIDALSSQLDAEQKEKKRLSGELDISQAQYQDSLDSYQELAIDHAHVQTQLDQTTNRRDELESSLKTAQEDARRVQSHWEHYQNSIAEQRQRDREDWQSQQLALQQQNHDLQSHLHGLSMQLQQLQEQLQKRHAEYSTLQTTLTEQNEAWQLKQAQWLQTERQLAQSSEQQAHRLSKLEDDVIETAQHKEQLQQANQQLQRQLQETTQELQEATKAHLSTQKQHAETLLQLNKSNSPINNKY